MLASLVSSATPKAPFIPPVCARLMWQATPSTLGSSKPSTTILSLGPRSRKLGIDGAGGAALGPADDPYAEQNHDQHNSSPENEAKPSHDFLSSSRKMAAPVPMPGSFSETVKPSAAYSASRQDPIERGQAFLRRFVAAVTGSVTRSSCFFRPPDTGRSKALWRRSGDALVRFPGFAPLA